MATGCQRNRGSKQCGARYWYNYTLIGNRYVDKMGTSDVQVFFASHHLAFDTTYLSYNEAIRLRRFSSSRAITWESKAMLFAQNVYDRLNKSTTRQGC